MAADEAAADAASLTLVGWNVPELIEESASVLTMPNLNYEQTRAL